MAKIQAIRGMNDILPEQTPVWQFVESTVRRVLAQYGYQEIRMPIVEQTDLFKRSIGEVTDIVEKEMYTFEDRNGDSLRNRRLAAFAARTLVNRDQLDARLDQLGDITRSILTGPAQVNAAGPIDVNAVTGTQETGNAAGCINHDRESARATFQPGCQTCILAWLSDLDGHDSFVFFDGT